MMDTQVCRVCGIEKSIVEFYVMNKSKNKYHVKCKKCTKAYTKTITKHGDYSSDDKQVCCKCGIEKKFSEFYVVKRNKTGYDTRCKVCFKILTDIRNESYLAGHGSYDGSEKKTCPVCGIEKTLNEFHKNKTSKNGHSGKCKECAILFTTEYFEDNKEQVNRKARERRAVNLEEYRARGVEYNKKYCEKYPDRKTESSRRYVRTHRDEMNEYSRQYRQRKPWMGNAAFKRYMSAKVLRYPSYANEEKIKIKYRVAQILTKITGVKHHVDHIIPLQGKLVSGFHHEDNLQVITAHENHVKSGSFTPCFIKINCSFIHYHRNEEIYQLP